MRGSATSTPQKKLGLFVNADHLDELHRIATAEHRSLSQKIRHMIELEVTAGSTNDR